MLTSSQFGEASTCERRLVTHGLELQSIFSAFGVKTVGSGELTSTVTGGGDKPSVPWKGFNTIVSVGDVVKSAREKAFMAMSNGVKGAKF